MKNKEFRKNIAYLLSDSTAFGLPKIFRRKRVFFKVFWIIFFFMGGIASIVFVCDAINSYFDFETVTKIETKFEQPLQFPTISFCPYLGGELNIFYNLSLNQIIKDCWQNLDKDCAKNPDKYFEQFKSPFHGKCFRFNSGKNESNHLIPFFFSALGGRDDSFYLKLNKTTDLWLWVHNVSSPPKFNLYNNHLGNSILISANTQTQIIIDKIIEKKLGLPYNQCYLNVNEFPNNKTIIDYISQTINETYKQTNCLELCYDVNYLKENPCNCSNTSIGQVWEDCFNVKEKSNLAGCIFNDKLKFFRESVLDKCKDYCPLECESVSYTVNLNTLTNRNETEIYIYYQSLKYTLISQLEKEKVFDLISNIGGIFGLFIGMSFVSLFEIGELFIEGFFILFIKKKNKIETIESQPDEFKASHSKYINLFCCCMFSLTNFNFDFFSKRKFII